MTWGFWAQYQLIIIIIYLFYIHIRRKNTNNYCRQKFLQSTSAYSTDACIYSNIKILIYERRLYNFKHFSATFLLILSEPSILLLYSILKSIYFIISFTKFNKNLKTYRLLIFCMGNCFKYYNFWLSKIKQLYNPQFFSNKFV